LKSKIGVIHGRFQPFHLEHLKYAMAAWSLCDHLIVGITNPDPTLTGSEKVDPNRSRMCSNPLTFYERLIIIRVSLLEAGIPYDSFDIIPFPVNRPELIKFYIPENVTHFMTIYDDWGRKKREMFKSIGFDVVVLWDKPIEEKKIIGKEIRQAICKGMPWEHWVSPAVARIIKEMGLIERIREVNDLTSEEFS